MAQVTIYTKPYCPYCVRAVSLLEKKGVPFTEIEAAFDPDKRREMIQRANGRSTFPQIFVGDVHVGRFITLTLTADSPDEAHDAAVAMCRQLLANPVTEDFKVRVGELISR